MIISIHLLHGVKNHPFLRRTEPLWERRGSGRTSGRLVDEPPRRAAYYLIPPSFHFSIFPLSTKHHRLTQILRLMATGNGERRHQVQGASFLCLRILFVGGCSLFSFQISRSEVSLMSAGVTKKQQLWRFTPTIRQIDAHDFRTSDINIILMLIRSTVIVANTLKTSAKSFSGS